MTTTVTVTTTDHPADVTVREGQFAGSTGNVNDRKETVEPNSSRDFTVGDDVQLLVIEGRQSAPMREFLNTGGSARLITDEDIARTNHQ